MTKLVLFIWLRWRASRLRAKAHAAYRRGNRELDRGARFQGRADQLAEQAKALNGGHHA